MKMQTLAVFWVLGLAMAGVGCGDDPNGSGSAQGGSEDSVKVHSYSLVHKLDESGDKESLSHVFETDLNAKNDFEFRTCINEKCEGEPDMRVACLGKQFCEVQLEKAGEFKSANISSVERSGSSDTGRTRYEVQDPTFKSVGESVSFQVRAVNSKGTKSDWLRSTRK